MWRSGTPQKSRGIAPAFCVKPWKESSVADRDTGDIGALERAAHALGLIALEPCEAGAVKLAIILGDNGLGERVGLVEHAARLALGGLDALHGLALALERSDLHDPAGTGGGGYGRLVDAALLHGLRRRGSLGLR